MSEVSKDGSTLTRICTFGNHSKAHGIFEYLYLMQTGTSLERKIRNGAPFHRFTSLEIKTMMQEMKRHGFVERVRLVKIWSWKKPLRLKFFTKTLRNMPPLARPALEKRIPQNSLDIVKSFLGNVDSQRKIHLMEVMEGKVNITSKQAETLEKLNPSVWAEDMFSEKNNLLAGLVTCGGQRLGIPYSQR